MRERECRIMSAADCGASRIVDMEAGWPTTATTTTIIGERDKGCALTERPSERPLIQQPSWLSGGGGSALRSVPVATVTAH